MNQDRRKDAGPILVVIGTRPEAVKLAPVVLALRRRGGRQVVVCCSGQHRELVHGALDSFGIVPDLSLDTMVAGQSLAALHARLFAAFGEMLEQQQPATVVVQGDTATVAIAAWAAFLARIEVVHVEAGLRSGDKWHPFPEEVNRRITGVLADWHFAPTALAVGKLQAEGVDASRIVLAGNTAVDAVLALKQRLTGAAGQPLAADPGQPLMVVTIHRRENFGRPLQDVCQAIRQLVQRHPRLRVVVPLHPNPEAGNMVRAELHGIAAVDLCEALDYTSFVRLLLQATLVLSDSGGIQEEGPSLGLPVLVARDVTERPEGVEAGAVRLVGTDTAGIVRHVDQLLGDPAAHAAMARPRSIYGDGLAAERIADVLLEGRLLRPCFVADTGTAPECLAAAV